MNDMNCLISYPRSGNTLIRFLIEYITERIVIDYNEEIPDSAIKYLVGNELSVIPKNPPILRKFHLVDESLSEKEKIGNSKVNLIIRDYYDCIVSHSKRGCTDSLETQIKKYCDLIRYYDWSKNQGSVIYYEDLVNIQKQPEILKGIFRDNEITEIPNWNNYLENIDQLNTKSKNGYTKIHNIVQKDYTNKEFFTQVVKINIGSHLFKKYLSRYE
jgi:hypothetical protein